jgi:hypothetical protein
VDGANLGIGHQAKNDAEDYHEGESGADGDSQGLPMGLGGVEVELHAGAGGGAQGLGMGMCWR